MAKRSYQARNAEEAAAEGMEAARRAVSNGPQQAAALFEAGDANLAAALRAGEAMVKGMTALQQEIADYTNAELKQGLSASDSLRNCRHPVELFNLQCDLARQATQRFFDEAGKLMSMAARIGDECWQPFEDRTRETLDRIAGR